MKRTQTGFTLMELMVALTVMAILVGFAVPSFREFTRNNRVTAAHNDLATAFTLARSESLKRSLPVSICATADGEDCGDADDWTSGWMVFVDNDGTAGTVDAADEIVQLWPAIAGDVVITSGEAFVQYVPSGTVIPDSTTTFDVYASGCHGDRAQRIAVSATGSLSAMKHGCP
jgi:type IV fimbrial biogenesis protein FimT